ncbi:MAG: glutaryl-CoA dehydrogenase, partial [Pseudonocardiales bacterium]|nr:glutaryl-CoA dehydrogenase [Pseudonocardiales bacterium]
MAPHIDTNPDFFGFYEMLSASEREELAQLREYLEKEVKPLMSAAW